MYTKFYPNLTSSFCARKRRKFEIAIEFTEVGEVCLLQLSRAISIEDFFLGLNTRELLPSTYTAQVTFVFPTSMYADPLACVMSPVFKTNCTC